MFNSAFWPRRGDRPLYGVPLESEYYGTAEAGNERQGNGRLGNLDLGDHRGDE